MRGPVKKLFMGLVSFEPCENGPEATVWDETVSFDEPEA
jgi:hypothetical protein